MQFNQNDIIKIEGSEYTVLHLLGKGKGGYSYLAKRDDSLVVLKCIHHEPCDYYTFDNKMESELRDYKTLKQVGINIPTMLAYDKEREIIVKTYIDGPTIKEAIDNKIDISKYIQIAKRFAKLAKQNGINIDYYPTNFIITGETLFYIDYECNLYDPRWDFDHWGITHWRTSTN